MMSGLNFSRYESTFITDHVLLWGNLSRINGLLIILNISMFFLTGLISKGYYYTFYSLGCLGIVGFATLLPTPLIRKLWYYLVVLAVEGCGAYFLIVSIAYWVKNSG